MADTFVLITGAWHGGWAWRPVAQHLRAAGARVLTPTLPGLHDGDDPTRHTLLHYYHAHPHARPELGTPAALQRLHEARFDAP
jgi:hypothetical protein